MVINVTNKYSVSNLICHTIDPQLKEFTIYRDNYSTVMIDHQTTQKMKKDEIKTKKSY